MTKEERMRKDALELDRIMKRASQLHVFEKMRKARAIVNQVKIPDIL